MAAEEDPVGEPGLVPNPFPGSKVGYPVYHGSRSKSVKKFRRPDNGVWFAGRQGWVDDLYTADGKGEVLTCWINVQNPYTPTEEENDWYYGDMDRISEEGFFKKLEEEGYDAYLQGGDSDSIAVFSKAEVVNALTGERM